MITEFSWGNSQFVERTSGLSKVNFVSGINLVVGPNGSGKSTILNFFTYDELLFELNKVEYKGTAKTFYHKSLDKISKGKGFSDHEPMNLQLGKIFNSSGEFLRVYLRVLMNEKSLNKGGYCIIVDEPEVSLDAQEIILFIGIIRRIAEKGNQVIIATHSPLLMAIPDINIIELQPMWKEKVMNIYCSMPDIVEMSDNRFNDHEKSTRTLA